MESARHLEARHASRGIRLSLRAINLFTCLGSAALSILIMLLIFMQVGMYPFGDVSPYFEDMYFQYIDFYQWFQLVLSGDANVFYSFSKSLGGNMLPTYLYYLASPLNLFLVFFGPDQIASFVIFAWLAHTGIAAFTMSFYVSKRFDLHPLLCVALGLCYALSQYILTQACNALWMDSVALFPLAAYGVYKAVRFRKPIVLYVTLFFCILGSWYAGYMCVVGLLLVFACEIVALVKSEKEEGGPTSDWRKGTLCFIVTMFLGGLTCAVILLPALFGVMSGKAAVPGVPSLLEYDLQLAPFSELFGSALLPFNYQKLWSGPQFFVGTLAVPLILFLFFCRRVPAWQKVTALAVLAVLFCSASFTNLDMVWTGFTRGANYYCRWGFVIEFFLVATAGLAVSYLKKPTVYEVVALSVAAVICLIIGFNVYQAGGFQPDQPYLKDTSTTMRYVIAFGVFLVALTGCLFASFKMRSSLGRTVLQSLFLLLVCVDLGCNAYIIIRNDSLVVMNMSTVSHVSDYVDNEAESLDSLKQYDDSVYRTEKTYSKMGPSTLIASNEGLAEGYRPFSQYLSTNDKIPTLFFQRMGYSKRSDIETYGIEFHTSYAASILPSDSLLGLKYVAAFECPEGYSDTGLVADKAVAEQGTSYWYQNENALPLGFGVASCATDTVERGASSFDYQNNLFKKLSGNDLNMYEPVEVTLDTREDGLTVWRIEGYDQDDILYAELESTTAYWAYSTVSQNRELLTPYFARFSSSIINVQKTESGVSYLGIGLDDEDLTLHVVKINRAAMEADFDAFKANPVTLNEFSDGHVEASYDAGEDGFVLFTIPADAGWSVKVNGAAVTPQAAADTLMAIPVTAGHNDITMDFTPRGFTVGAGLSSVGLLCFVGWRVASARRRKSARPQLRHIS